MRLAVFVLFCLWIRLILSATGALSDGPSEICSIGNYNKLHVLSPRQTVRTLVFGASFLNYYGRNLVVEKARIISMTVYCL